MLNKAIIQGRLGGDPELKITPSGVSVTSCGLACERNYAAQGQQRETDWIDVVAWRGTAEFLHKWFRKGDMVVVAGRLQTRMWTDQQGVKRKIVEVMADEVNFCGGGRREDNRQGRPEFYKPIDADDDDELPFV